MALLTFFIQPRELEIDPRTGMKNYIANGTAFLYSIRE